MEKAKVFVIMPFEDSFFEAYEMIRSQFQNDYDFSNAANEDNQQNILADIVKPIYFADIILADLTGLNPNVMYELGIAHALKKKTIVITQDDLNCLPFDLKQYRARNYSTHYKKFFELLDYLKKHFEGAINNTVDFSSPITDFLAENNNVIKTESNIMDFNGEMGFLDYLADIDENTQSMADNLLSLTSNLTNMNDGINRCTAEITRVQKSGGQGVASFVRKKAKEIAEYMHTLSQQLKEHNKTNEDVWNNIEKNLLGLLENQHATSEENQGQLVVYLQQLHSLKQAIIRSKEGITTIKESNKNNIGLERSLNQSIRFLDEDLTTYLTVADQMCSGIDRIVAKSKFVVGDIKFEK